MLGSKTSESPYQVFVPGVENWATQPTYDFKLDSVLKANIAAMYGHELMDDHINLM